MNGYILENILSYFYQLKRELIETPFQISENRTKTAICNSHKCHKKVGYIKNSTDKL